MAKKTQQIPDTIITIRLPGQGGLIRQANILAARGDIAKLESVEYKTLADLLESLADVLDRLTDLETNPLPDIVTTDADAYDPGNQYGGYRDWEPSDYEWGWNGDDYQLPQPAAPAPVIPIGDATVLADKRPPTPKLPESTQLAMF